MVYCMNCDDLVFDPTFERTRLANGSRKRKLEEFASQDDYRLVAANSNHVLCRAIGLRGFYNMGNTCFMSVVLQCLLHNPLVRAHFLGNGHSKDGCVVEYCVSCALDEIFTEFYSTEKTEGFGAVNMLMNTWKTADVSQPLSDIH
jgi:ubiquitin carboxyl-terminal hydrolase 22/27/51